MIIRIVHDRRGGDQETESAGKSTEQFCTVCLHASDKNKSIEVFGHALSWEIGTPFRPHGTYAIWNPCKRLIQFGWRP